MRARGRVEIDAAPVPILVAALGRRMLGLAGRETDGTTLWMVGPEHDPRPHHAHDHRGGDSSRPVCAAELAGVNICVTSDPDDVPGAGGRVPAVYGTLPVLCRARRRGRGRAEDLLVVGDEDVVEGGLRAYAAAGATDARVSIHAGTDEELERCAVLRSVALTV